MREKIYSVAELNRIARSLLEEQLALVRVSGEISNLARPVSGHLYFSLKDSDAQVRCAMFRSRAQLLDFDLDNGQQVTARGRVSLYEARGEFQLLIEHLAPAGTGALQHTFERLKQKLFSEGLFDPKHKQALPALPQRVGVITSPSGAAIRDILSVLQRRFAGIAVRIYAVPVQGKEAPTAIVKALQQANQRRDCDVLLLTRGGGSLEDLWAFNDEQVARAIFASQLPVISAVGHEIDVSMSDFVADVRAPTPSAAAELLSPDTQHWQTQNQQLKQRLQRAMSTQLQQKQRHVYNLQARLRHPRQTLDNLNSHLSRLDLRLQQSLRSALKQQQQHIQQLQARLQQHNPTLMLPPLRLQQQYLQARLHQAMQHKLEDYQQHLHRLLHNLDTVSPLATLQRGYAIVLDQQGQIIRRARALQADDEVQVRLAEGELRCRVLG